MSDSAQEKGRCHVCWEEDFLTRTKFYLPIACECCGPTHVEIVYHCFTCTPKIPRTTKIEIATAKLLDPIFEGLFKQRK